MTIYVMLIKAKCMIYLDSAIVGEARSAVQLGWIKGITTNPALLSKSNLPPEETLKQLAEISPGELYYQLSAFDFERMLAEARRAYEIIGKKTVLKVPATAIGFRAVASLSPEIPCAVTAIYTPAQAAVAREAGAKYAIAYVNRATRLLGDGLALVREMAAVLRDSDTKILAASLKSAEEASAALQAGADHLTLPLEILNSMSEHYLSLQTVEDFFKDGVGINY